MLDWIRSILTGGPSPDPGGIADGGDSLVEYLLEQVAPDEGEENPRSVFDAYRRLPPAERADRLPDLYLRFEQRLVQQEQSSVESRRLLRRRVADRFPAITEREPLRPIFQEPARQEVLLARAFLIDVIDRTRDQLGFTHRGLREWLEEVPEGGVPPDPYADADAAPRTDGARLALLEGVAERLFADLEERVGEAAERILDASYQDLADRYGGLETFPIVVRLLPRSLLDSKKLQLLSFSEAGDRLETIRAELSAASRELRRTRAELEAVLDTAGEGIITLDQTGRIVLANQEVEHLWGVEVEQVNGQPVSSLFTLEDRPSDAGLEPPKWFIEHRLPSLLERPQELEARREDGSTFPAEARANKTWIHDRLFYTCSVRDVTRQKEYERGLIEALEQAEEMSRLKTTLLTNMSHEIRTPLTSILGFAELLEEESDCEHEFVGYITSGGRRLLQTLNSVLDLAKLEAGEWEMSREPVDLGSVLEEMVPLFEPQAREAGLTFRVVGADENVRARADGEAIRRIAQNLISNAIKFTEGGSVEVEAGTAERPYLRVRDTGIGMSEETQEEIFQAFRQESTGMSRIYEGTGLGLTIVEKLTGLLGADLELESAKGEGTVFTVYFEPVVEEKAEAG